MDFVLKQRLVGAVVLVALAVIFIPMLLEGPDRNLVPEMAPLPEPRDQAPGEPLERFPQAGEIPDAPEREVVQADEAPSVAGSAEATVGENATPLALPEPDAGEPEAPPAEQPAPAAATQPAPVAAPAGDKPEAPGPLGNWVVQMGSFSSEQNALRLRDRLRKEHFATQVEKVTVGGKTLYRVRVGPYLERAEAEADQKKLAAGFDLKGRVLSYP